VEPTTKLRSPEGAEYYSPGRKSWVSLRTSESRRDGRNETGHRAWEGHGFTRAATVLQSCHSEPSVAALARGGRARNLLFGPPVHDELTFSRKRFVSGHGFSRATKVLQSCHSEPSATALARRELALSEAKGHARNLLLVRRFTYEPIFLHREIRIRARLQPCRHSPPKLLFRAVRNRARAARACPVLAEALSEVERKSKGRARNLHLVRRFTMN